MEALPPHEDEGGAKKSPFDNLSREELVKKCKGLLTIAQKAKQSRSDMLLECDHLKEKCQNLEKQKAADKESLRMMQEFIETLTEQKLNYATELDYMKTAIANHKSLSENMQQEIKTINIASEEQQRLLKNELHDLQNKIASMDTENTSLKRQNKRLQDDNENLIIQLDEIEKQTNKSVDERQSNLNESSEKDQDNPIDSVNDLDNISKQLKICKNDLEKFSAENLSLTKHIEEKDGHILTVENELASEKSKKEKLNARLKAYKDKLEKCKMSIVQLKNSKSVLLKTVKDYSESVPVWQRDILNASKLLSEKLLQLESENNDLKAKLLSNAKNNVSEETNNVDQSSTLSDENNALNAKLNLITKELNDLQHEKEVYNKNLLAITSENEFLNNNLKSLENEKMILVNEKVFGKETIQKIEAEKLEMESAVQELNNDVSFYKSEILKLKESIDRIENEKTSVQEELKMMQDGRSSSENATLTILKEELLSLKSAIVSVEEENKLLCESNELLKSQLDPAGDEQSTPEIRKLVEQNDSLQTDISKLQTKLKTYKTDNLSLNSELKEARQRLMDVESVLQDYESMKAKLANFKSENSEYLKEMKEINQVMKERGETISKQYMEISDMNRKLQQLEEELRRLRENNDRKDEEILKITENLKDKDNMHDKYNELVIERDNTEALLKERDGIIISLQDDIEKLKHNQGNVSFDTRSDNLSISTLSRVEENSRLKDLDESFEERYSKLRLLALKLKKRITELTLQNKALEETNNKLENDKTEINDKLLKLGNTAKNIQSIQSEYDRITDELERKNIEHNDTDGVINELKNELAKSRSELETVNLKVSQLLKDLDFTNQEKASSEIIIKELQSKLENLQNDSEDIRAKDVEISKIKDSLALKESQLVLAESQHQLTKESLEKAKREVKKKSVLSLEMEDYEKSMKELTNKMEDDKKKIVQMESTIDTQQATITSLKTQIKMLEDQMSTDEKITKEVKDLLNRATENAKEKENVIISKNEIISNLEKNVEDCKLCTDELNLQLATALGEKEKSAITFGHEKSDLQSKLKRFENKANEIEELLSLKTTELEDVKTEFTGYKLRAQSILRQNNKKDVNLEENLKEEMAALKAEIDSLRVECENLRSQVETLQLERSRLAARCTEQQQAISSAQNERENIAVQYSSLLKKEAQEQQNIKLQMSTLTQCYKKQIAELEESSAEQISKLRKELDFSRASMARAGIVNTANAPIPIKKPQLQFIAIDSIQSSTDSGNSPNHDCPDASGEINVALLEREEGEGSESTPSPSPTCVTNINRRGQRGRREPMPLDQLLETVIPEDESGLYLEGDTEQQLASAIKQIETRDKRLTHLTELVAEAEKEVARRSQLVETLKEEVRRCQRALDRGLHHHNQEYLKNVIVKFLTLNAGDERSRLVPVLNTILTLSPEESQQLNAVAKGLDANSNRGWGSYLPWPGNR